MVGWGTAVEIQEAFFGDLPIETKFSYSKTFSTPSSQKVEESDGIGGLLNTLDLRSGELTYTHPCQRVYLKNQ